MYNQLIYFSNICKIQDDFIKGKIDNKEFENKMKQENLKYSVFLEGENANLKFNQKTNEVII